MIVLEIKASRRRHIGDLSRSDNTEIEREDRADAVRFQWYGVLAQEPAAFFERGTK